MSDRPWQSKYRVMYGEFDPTWLSTFEVFGNTPQPLLQSMMIEDLKGMTAVQRENIKHLNDSNFYKHLLTSVEQEGFRNPVMILDSPQKGYRKWIPYGRSRFWCAIILGIKIPAFVCDRRGFNPRYDSWEEITSVEQALEKFIDLPQMLEFNKTQFQFWGCTHTELDTEYQEQIRQKMKLKQQNEQRCRDGFADRYEGFCHVPEMREVL